MVELIWHGKYDKDGKKVAPLRVPLPFQMVETINESAQQRQLALEAWGTGKGTEWRNRLIWGDKKYVLPSLLQEFAGQVDLIYIDPPFATGQNFSFSMQVDGLEFTKASSIIEQKAYRDTWGRGPDSWIQWFYETVALLRELMTDTGMLYVHLDSRKVHYAKAIMDEVFGEDNFRNHISWKRTNAHGNATYQFGQIQDSLLSYARTEATTMNQLYGEYHDPEAYFPFVEEGTGRRYASQNLTNYNKNRPNLTYTWKGHRRTWLFTEDKMGELDRQSKIVYSSTGYPRLKQYQDESPGIPVGDFWEDIKALKHAGAEVLPYPTQKPEALLARIIKASSNEGDLVLDCFVGSGTTAAVAEKLGRRWIACDLSRFAIHTTRKRLLSIPNVKPFVVQNLGKYERQLWQAAEFGESAQARVVAYRRFILELYKAQPITGYSWLHGVKAGRMVHVGAVDSPVSTGDISQIAAEFRRAVGSGKDAPTTNGVDVLGWDFAFELNEVARQQAAQANINLRFLKIPHDAMDRRAVEQGDVRFFELAALSVDVAVKGREVSLSLTDFVIPPDDVPEDVRRAIKHWSQWVDYWAVDWANKGDAFHNQWQTYRTRKVPTLRLISDPHLYAKAGPYRILVKAIDIFGNGTTQLLEVAMP